MFFEQLHHSWQSHLFSWKNELDALEQKLLQLDIVPSHDRVMRVFQKPIDEYRVLILGQDPYPNPEHACGLAFAIEGDSPLPPSLRNIFTELESDIGKEVIRDRDISKWQSEGVMLLNRSLTTLSGQSDQHSELWSGFTEDVVRILAKSRPLVSVLWGRKAQQMAPILGSTTVISSAHPSPLSSYRGFFGSKPFSKVNQALIRLGEQPIDWTC